MKPNKKKKQLYKEMRKEINNWINSSIYIQLKKKLDEKKEKLLYNLDMSKAITQKKEAMMTEKELIEFCQAIIEADNQPDIATDWILSVINSTRSIQVVLQTYNSILIDYYLYLFDYIQQEKYEVAELIKKVIAIEEKQFLNICVNFYGQTEQDIVEYIKVINEACLDKINKMLDERK